MFRRVVLPTTGWDIWSDPARHDAVRDELASAYLFIDSAAADVMRIEQGLPRWGRELTDEIIPIEANLEQRTIDYRKGLLHRPGSDLPNQNVRTNQQTIVRIDLAEQHAAPAWDETRRSFSIWKRSRLDHERHAQPTTWKRNRARVRETRLQQSCHEFGSTFAGSGWSNSGRSRFASVSLKNFAASEFLLRSQRASAAVKLEKEILFCPRALNL